MTLSISWIVNSPNITAVANPSNVKIYLPMLKWDGYGKICDDPRSTFIHGCAWLSRDAARYGDMITVFARIEGNCLPICGVFIPYANAEVKVKDEAGERCSGVTNADGFVACSFYVPNTFAKEKRWLAVKVPNNTYILWVNIIE